MAFLHVEEKNGEIINISIQNSGDSPILQLGFNLVYSTPVDVAFYAFDNPDEVTLENKTLVVKHLYFEPVAYNLIEWKTEYEIDSFGYITSKKRVEASNQGGIYVDPEFNRGKPKWNFETEDWDYEDE